LLEITKINANDFLHTHKPENVNDGNLSTIWSTSGNNSWIEFDLGCKKIISVIDIAWHYSDKIKYNYTLQILPDRNNTVPVLELVAITDVTPLGMSYQSIGGNNSQGRFIKVYSNEQSERATDSANFSISEVKIHGYDAQSSAKNLSNLEKSILEKVWQNISMAYPQTIKMSNSNGSIAEIPLTAISDGDADPICNPYYQISETPVIALNIDKPFTISINEFHVEGINPSTKTNDCFEDGNKATDRNNKTANSGELIFRPLNNTDTVYEGNTTKQFIFVPLLDTKENYDKSIYDMAVSIATSDETSIDFVSRVRFY
jgi:hypothetical protein